MHAIPDHIPFWVNCIPVGRRCRPPWTHRLQDPRNGRLLQQLLWLLQLFIAMLIIANTRDRTHHRWTTCFCFSRYHLGTHRVYSYSTVSQDKISNILHSGILVLGEHSASHKSSRFRSEMLGNFVLWVMWLVGAVDTTVSTSEFTTAYGCWEVSQSRTELSLARTIAVLESSAGSWPPSWHFLGLGGPS